MSDFFFPPYQEIYHQRTTVRRISPPGVAKKFRYLTSFAVRHEFPHPMRDLNYPGSPLGARGEKGSNRLADVPQASSGLALN